MFYLDFVELLRNLTLLLCNPGWIKVIFAYYIKYQEVVTSRQNISKLVDTDYDNKYI